MVVQFPPHDANDAEEWARALLTDVAGWPDPAAELLEAVWDVQVGRIPEWSAYYNVYGVNVRPNGARITFDGFPNDGCTVPLEVLAAVVSKHLQV